MKTRVLFVCVHNSDLNQMAEAWLNNICGDSFEAHSAGLEPGTLNPLTVKVTAEKGIDISKNIRDQIREKIKVWCEEVCQQAATSAV